jgi:hypothetical protein
MLREHAPCVICGGPMTRHPHEKFGRFENRKTCGCISVHEYQTRLARKRWEIAVARHAQCPVCRRPFAPYKHEGLRVYITRDFCSKSCARRAGAKPSTPPDRKGQMKPPLIAQSVADYLKNGGSIIMGPPAFTAPSQHPPTLARSDEDLRILRAVPVKRGKPRSHDWLFNKPPSGASP